MSEMGVGEMIGVYLSAGLERKVLSQGLDYLTKSKLEILVGGRAALSQPDPEKAVLAAMSHLAKMIDSVCTFTRDICNTIDVELLDLLQATMRGAIAIAEKEESNTVMLQNYVDAQEVLELWRTMTTTAPEVIRRMSVTADVFYADKKAPRD